MSEVKRTPAVELIDPTVIDLLRRQTPADCIAMVGDANETARLLSAAGVRYQHPDWSEEQVAAEVARRMLG
jgi:hypothetical protein